MFSLSVISRQVWPPSSEKHGLAAPADGQQVLVGRAYGDRVRVVEDVSRQGVAPGWHRLLEGIVGT